MSISLLGENLLEEIESNLTLTFQLQLTGYSYGVIPVTVVPVSYSDFEILRTNFDVNSTLNEIAAGRVIPPESALPCENLFIIIASSHYKSRYCTNNADLDFDGTTQTFGLVANLNTLTATVTFPVYNDGIPESEEGFVVLIGVLDGDLDERDIGFVDVLNRVVLVTLLDSGKLF